MPSKTKNGTKATAATCRTKKASKGKKDDDTPSDEPEPVGVEQTLNKQNVKNGAGTNDDESEEGSLDIGACCLCHSSMDFSDRAAFFRADRQEDFNEDTDNEEEYYFRPNDPYLPVELYDPSNALIYCDGCSRMYHQKCHFCPVTVIPRGDWHCLLCNYFSSKATTSPGGKKKSKSPVRRKEKSTSCPTAHKTDPKLYRQMHEAYTTQQLFVSPPVRQVAKLEAAWEFESRHMKATHFQSHVVKRLKQYVESQASGYRLAETALVTLTSTSKNRSHFLKHSASQELAQTLVKLYGIRRNWRRACYMLHDLQRATDTKWNLLQTFCDDLADPDFVKRILFPFGRQYGRRVEPRTAEAKLAWNRAAPKDTPPTEITVRNGKKGKTKKQPPVGRRSGKEASPPPPVTARKDDDSGISLDDLQCCVCRTSDATDDNDLVLCDGQGCFRAYHAHCVSPVLKQADLEENVDWFCPYCSALADIFLAVQTVHMGDEWEQERYAAMLEEKDLDSSLQSWANVEQIFPTTEQDYAIACQMKEGKRNKATDDLLARVLGLDELPDHDSDDEVEDGDFDVESYQKGREDVRKKQRGESEGESEARNEDNGDESSRSSQATLVEMSSVELEVGRAELDALSMASSDDDEDDDGKGANRRRSRRLRKPVDCKGRELVDNIGEFDEANIVEGKRGRKPVDYIQLNQAIFGDAPDEDAGVLDDSEEFQQTSKKQAVKSEDEESGGKNDSEDDGDDDSDEANEDNQDASSEESDSNDEVCSVESEGDKKKEAVSKKSVTTKNGRKRKAGMNGAKQVPQKGARRNDGTRARAGKRNSSPESKDAPVEKHSPKNGKTRKTTEKHGTSPRRKEKGPRSKKNVASKSNGRSSSAKKAA